MVENVYSQPKSLQSMVRPGEVNFNLILFVKTSSWGITGIMVKKGTLRNGKIRREKTLISPIYAEQPL